MKRKRLLCKRALTGPGQALLLRGHSLLALGAGGGSLHSRRPASNSNARHFWSWFSLSAAQDPDPSGRDARTRGRVPAPRSQQRPPPQPHSRLPSHFGSELPRLGVTHPLPDSSLGSPPVPGVSVSHPEDECVDQQDALETSDDRFGLQPPRRGRHDSPETLPRCARRSEQLARRGAPESSRKLPKSYERPQLRRAGNTVQFSRG